MNFHLGKPILVLLVIAVVAGVAAAFRPAPRKADLTVWLFAESHHRTYLKLIPEFERKHNVTVNLSLLNGRAVVTRLGQMFMKDLHDPEIPDLVELEIGLAGRFFRPPVREIGLLPLDDRLKASGWDEKIVKSRVATWSKEGIAFGMPHDLHPCVITYRHDLFTEAGVDLSKATTWPAFHEACLKFEAYWRSRGQRYRHAMEMQESSADNFQQMLLQRGLNPIDTYGNVLLDKDPRFAQTLAFYGQMVGGPRKVTAQTSTGMVAFGKDVVEGNLCAMMTPDWRLTYVKLYAAGAAGKLRVMPLPVFDPSDAPTSTWGGTMIGITKASKRPDVAWALVEHLYFSEQGLRARRESSEVLPPIKTLWADPYYHTADPFFDNQKVGTMLTDLAGQVPTRYVTAATPIVNTFLNEAVAKAVRHADEHGSVGLDAACEQWMAEVAGELRVRMKQWKVDP